MVFIIFRRSRPLRLSPAGTSFNHTHSAGYTTISMDEFPKGTEFTERMRDACQQCRRLLPLYSGDYWESGACTTEFDTYWNQHFGNKTARFIVPLEIEPCTVPDAHRQLLFESLHTLTSVIRRN